MTIAPLQLEPYESTRAVPNVVVDGAANEATVLTLSHWPRSGTPERWAADASAEMAFRFLDDPDEAAVATGVVTIDHFDEDGLVSLHVMTDPEHALAHRARLIEVACAGDFGRWREREAIRIVFAIEALADADTSPLPPATFAGGYPEKTAALHAALLPRVPELLADPDRHRALWAERDARLERALAALDDGRVAIEEVPALDLAVVTLDDREDAALLDPKAINRATDMLRVLELHRGRAELRFRYESWVQYRTRLPAPRVDLTALATELSAEEPGEASWSWDGVDEIIPRLRLEGAEASALAPGELRARIERALREGEPAWDPYAPPGG